MHENVPNLDIILVQCIVSVTVNSKLLASLTQEKFALTPNGVLNHRSQQQHKLKTFKRVKTNFSGWSCHISKQNKVITDISSGYVHRKLACNLSIWFSYFQSSSWWCPGEDCPIQHVVHVTYETASCSSSHFSWVIETNNWFSTAIEAIHRDNYYDQI